MKIQINSKKTRFWKEKSVEEVVALGPTRQATLVNMAEWASLRTLSRIDGPFCNGCFNPFESFFSTMDLDSDYYSSRCRHKWSLSV